MSRKFVNDLHAIQYYRFLLSEFGCDEIFLFFRLLHAQAILRENSEALRNTSKHFVAPLNGYLYR